MGHVRRYRYLALPTLFSEARVRGFSSITQPNASCHDGRCIAILNRYITSTLGMG